MQELHKYNLFLFLRQLYSLNIGKHILTMNQYTHITLKELLDKLDKQKGIHIEIMSNILQANNSSIYPLDLVSLSVAKRSMSIISGFIEMIRLENFICAVPLLRMQLDNSLRFYGAFLVENPHKFATEFIEGKHISNFKDKDTNQRLTDRYLVNKLAEHYPWITNVYKTSSSYIHLSDSHLFNTLEKKTNNKSVNFIINEKDTSVTEFQRLEATYTMFNLTTIVLWALNSWAITKEGITPQE